jgi:hypothetical protein
MGKMRSMHVDMRNEYILAIKPEIDQFKHIGIDGRIILKWTSKKQAKACGLDSVCSVINLRASHSIKFSRRTLLHAATKS